MTRHELVNEAAWLGVVGVNPLTFLRSTNVTEVIVMRAVAQRMNEIRAEAAKS